MKNQRLHIWVSGRVQGVFFRKHVLHAAEKLHSVRGMVQNLTDGRVEIIAEGDKNDLIEVLRAAEQGSPMSSVKGVQYEWQTARNEFAKFEIIKSKQGYIADKLAAAEQMMHNFLDKKSVPQHVGIIPDGNRRWAKMQSKTTAEGHQAGAENMQRMLEALCDAGVKYTTIWGFSTENWKRTEVEVAALMKIFERYLYELRETAHKKQVRIVHFGRKDRIPGAVLAAIQQIESETAHYDEHYLGLALDYGGRDELLRAITKAQQTGSDITETAIDAALDTGDFPDLDLVIRTSGEQRLSGFMPWQSVYAEIYFAAEMFPDFDAAALQRALADYALRKRRFGK